MSNSGFKKKNGDEENISSVLNKNKQMCVCHLHANG